MATRMRCIFVGSCQDHCEEASCAAPLFRPICCSASPCGPAPDMRPPPAGKHCRLITGYGLDGNRHRVRWPLPAYLASKSWWCTLPTTQSCCLGKLSEAMAIRQSAIQQLTRRLTHPAKFGICSTASSAGDPLTDVAEPCPSPSTTGVITTTLSGTEHSWFLAMGMG